MKEKTAAQFTAHISTLAMAKDGGFKVTLNFPEVEAFKFLADRVSNPVVYEVAMIPRPEDL